MVVFTVFSMHVWFDSYPCTFTPCTGNPLQHRQVLLAQPNSNHREPSVLKKAFWFSFLVAVEKSAVGVCLNCRKIKVTRTANSWWIQDLGKGKTLSSVPEELDLQFELWRHSEHQSFLVSEGITISLRWNIQCLLSVTAEPLVTVARRTVGSLAAHGCLDFLFSEASLPYTPCCFIPST